MEKINCSGMGKNRGRLDIKRELGLLIINRRSNNNQLLPIAIQVVSFSYYLNYFYQSRKV